MDESSSSDDIQFFIDQISEKYMVQIKNDRQQSEQKQMQDMKHLLQEWADKITNTTKEIVGSIQSANKESPLDGIVDDIKDRQSKMIAAIQSSHDKQMEILKTAISEERKEAAHAQFIFEQTLKTRYESMVDALHEKVKAEQEARMQRALDNLERSAKIESERAKQSFEIQQEAEVTLSKKFKSIVSDLRKSWEEEEIGRAMQLEERLRSHYSVVLEHMEAQLKMALQLQDDADKQWLEDVESRNRQQMETLKGFEEKCRRLYDTRLAEYADKTSQQITEYEEQLLQSGKELASERVQFESRLRRIKLACSRWKVAYQKDVHDRYLELTTSLEERYLGEVNKLLTEISELNQSLAEANKSIEQKEKEIIKTKELHAHADSHHTNALQSHNMREELEKRWNELKTPVADRVDSLVALLDASKVTPQMLSVYEALNAKLSARQPIAQLVSRKQYIEYKLKLASRIGGEGSNLSASDRAQLITELTDIQTNVDSLCKQYERKFGESFFKSAAVVEAGGNGVAGLGAVGATPSTPQHPASARSSLVVPNSPAASTLPPPVTPSIAVANKTASASASTPQVQPPSERSAAAAAAAAAIAARSPIPIPSMKRPPVN